MKYEVKRQHYGDRLYQAGETREAKPADVGHLVPGTLEPVREKAASAPKNKARVVPKNKAD
jgi:hypothetical protein